MLRRAESADGDALRGVTRDAGGVGDRAELRRAAMFGVTREAVGLLVRNLGVRLLRVAVDALRARHAAPRSMARGTVIRDSAVGPWIARARMRRREPAGHEVLLALGPDHLADHAERHDQ